MIHFVFHFWNYNKQTVLVPQKQEQEESGAGDMSDSLWITILLGFLLKKRPTSLGISELQEDAQEIFFKWIERGQELVAHFSPSPQGDISRGKNQTVVRKQIKQRFLLLSLLFFTDVICQQMNTVWNKLRILFPSSNHEGKSCYLRLIQVQRRARELSR